MRYSRLTNTLIFTLVVTAAYAGLARGDDAKSAADQEQELLAILQSDAPPAEKAIVCKKLAVYGSNAAVPELAKLLPNPQLSSWSRIALEAIPGEEANRALRKSSETLKGRLLVGVLNSIGVRRDAQAVDLLTAKLENADADIASAAAVALGQIGNDGAEATLLKALTKASGNVRNAVAEACVLVAERRHGEGNTKAAVAIYDTVRGAEVPKQRVVEATRGAILARKEAGAPLLLEALRSSDKVMFQLALSVAREFPGAQLDTALASELSRTQPDRAALLIQAMADRTETVVLSAILDAAGKGDKRVRLSAIEALQRVGDASCLPALIQIAGESDDALMEAAKTTLAVLPGDEVGNQIVTLLPKADGKTRLLLIELVGLRRIDAIPELVEALDHSEQSVRSAALVSLGETVPLDKLSLLISRVVDPKRPEDVKVATGALRSASVRMPDQEACAARLTDALEKSPAATKTPLLEIISEVGGGTALQTLAAAAKDDDPELQDTASRLLGKWNGVEAAPVLLDLAKTAPEKKFQIRALRGYIGLARKFAMPPQQRAAMCEKALAAAQRVDERKLVLDVLQLHPSVPGLKLAIAAKRRNDIQREAEAAIRVIAQKLRRKGVDVSKLLSNS